MPASVDSDSRRANTTSDALAEERAYYDEHLAEWLTRFPGRFVLVKGRELAGAYNTMDEALSDGARHFGLDSFLVRQVLPAQPEASAPALTLGILHADSPRSDGGSGAATGR
jgi:hypothetical protein